MRLVCWFFLVIGNVFFVVALYEQCNHEVKLQSGQKLYINSPYYPGLYPVGTSCRYAVQAPDNHLIQFKCDLKLQTPSTDLTCRKEVFHFNAEGDEVLTTSEYFCGSGKFERKSFLNRAVISYISQQWPEKPPRPKLKDKVAAAVTTSTSTTTTTTPPPPIAEEEDVEEDLSDEVLHVLQDVGVSDALAYVASLLYDEPVEDEEERNNVNFNNGHTVYLKQLPSHSSSKTSAKRGKIVSGFLTPSTEPGVAGGGRFSCLIEAQLPNCDCGWSLPSPARIATPTNDEAALHEFPPMAGVLTKKQGKVFCGAAIIHQYYLLSAAHCFVSSETKRAELLRIVVGEHRFETPFTRRYDLQTLILHEQFAQLPNGQLKNDIALLKTQKPITWSRYVGPACLPLQAALNGKKLPLVGQQVIAAGWGTTSYGGPQTHRLLKTNLDVIDGQQCRNSLGTVPTHIFCTYTPGRDTCQYDSGGALYERSAQGRLMAVGIVSFGLGCATQQPSVNTRVASFVKWIRGKTPEVAYCLKSLS
ncbi:LOW QUALITY PROTEIN: uncharacterized protein Dwil_GK15768 [Drosophila willistoni]|uniref:Peptidase S1 domain-containing protein n=1 Tax=Drosophila willistoni TaxID=7260 RepID=B4MRF4_DROWI|nr:LOW QUALITY PROTEIN: uncharacterized protein Dwil_GK15768 [Drosophila willistoni]